MVVISGLEYTHPKRWMMKIGNCESVGVAAIDDGRPRSHMTQNAVRPALVFTFIVLAMCRDNEPTLIPTSVTTVDASYAEMQFNRGITDLSVLKDEKTGEVVAAFTWDERRTAYDYHVASGVL